MTQVVSFEGFTPAARFDALPWTEVRIEEGATSGGPWTLIETVPLVPLDADPANPQERDFTTEQATGDGLWYRVVFADADGDTSQPTDPIQNFAASAPVSASVPCSPWISGDDVAGCCNVETSSGVIFDAVAEQASDLLFTLSGRLYAGECGPRTVRPDCDSCWCGYQVLSRGHIVGPQAIGYPLDSLCGSCLTACEPSMVKLAGYPVRAINEVKLSGTALASTEYALHNGRYLVRLNSVRWPISQNLTLPDTDDHTWSVTYTYGADPPALGVAAAAQLGCEIYKACAGATGGDCVLPTGVTRITRQGVTIDRLAFTSWSYREGRWATGLALVDAFLASVNPSGLQRRPVLWAPGGRQYAQSWGP